MIRMLLLLPSLLICFASIIAHGQQEFVIADILPTLAGNENRASLFGWDGGDGVTIQIDHRPGERFVFARRPRSFLGRGSIEFGFKGEAIITGTDGRTTVGYGGIRDNSWWFTANIDYEGSEYSITGERLHLLGYIFESDKEKPLLFKLVKGKGFVYVSGKGVVTLKDGRQVKLGD